MNGLGRAVVLWLTFGLVAAACGPPGSGALSERAAGSRPTATHVKPKRITAALQGDPGPLYPGAVGLFNRGGPRAAPIRPLIYAGLAVLDNQGALRPQLAKAPPSLENGLWKLHPDGRMETTWRIEATAQWQDGTAFTSDDLLFTMKVVQDKDLPFTGDMAYGLIESVEASDARTVTAKWKDSFIYAATLFTESLAMPLPRHVLERAHADHKASFMDLPHWTHEYIGAGPYKLQEWAEGSHMVVEANDRYILGRPKIDQIEVRFIPDTNTLMANILAGQVDLQFGTTLSLEQAAQLREQWKDGTVGTIFTNWIVIFPQLLNPNPAVVADLRFRQALLHAIDRQQMADSLMLGLSSVAHSYINPNAPEYKDIEGGIVRYDYDPQKALRLMEELGYRKGADGLLRDGTTQKLAFEFRTTSVYDIHVKAFFPIVDYWQKLGVAVDPVVVPPQRAADREYRATFPALEVIRYSVAPERLANYHSSKMRIAANNFGGTNYMNYHNPDWDALLDRYYITIPREQRNQVLQRIIHHISDQLIMMGVFYEVSSSVASKRLKGVTDEARGWNVHEWELSGA